MSKQQWKYVARRMGEARDAMMKIGSEDAARIFGCLEHFALACLESTLIPDDDRDKP